VGDGRIIYELQKELEQTKNEMSAIETTKNKEMEENTFANNDNEKLKMA
jgi:hypothetical protein